MSSCAFCGAEVLAHEGAREITTWEVRAHGRRTLAGGRKETGRLACVDCARDLVNRLEPNTPKLL